MILLSQFICTNLALPVSIKCLSDSTAKLRETKSGCCQTVAKKGISAEIAQSASLCNCGTEHGDGVQMPRLRHITNSSQVTPHAFNTNAEVPQRKVAKCQSAKTPGARCHAYLTSHSILAPVSIIRRPCITCTLCATKELAARVAGDLQRMCSLEV